MKHPTISIIAVIGLRRELGKDNKLLWNIKADMERFKNLTVGHTVIMGRKTYESIGRALSRRFNIVITREKSLKIKGGLVVHSFEEALQHAWEVEKREVFVIGGGQIYEEAMKYADKLYLTIVKETNTMADTFFPEYSRFAKAGFKEAHEEKGLKFTFLELTK